MVEDDITTPQANAINNMCPAAYSVSLGTRLDAFNNAIITTTPGYAATFGTVALTNATPNYVATGLSTVAAFFVMPLNVPTIQSATPITATPSTTTGRMDVVAGAGTSGATNCYWMAKGTF